MVNPAPISNHSIHLPKWLVISCLLFIPPVGWWHMWKNHRYHSWFPYILWLNSAIMLGFAAYVALHFYPLLKTFFDTATYIFLSHIGLIILALFEIVFGFYLIKSFKNKAMLKTRVILSIILLLFINAIAIPISQLFISSHINSKIIKKTAVENQNQTTNWKTYSSNNEMFTFSYPGEYIYVEHSRNHPYFYKDAQSYQEALDCTHGKSGGEILRCPTNQLFDVYEATNFPKSKRNFEDDAYSEFFSTYTDTNDRVWSVIGPVYGLGGNQTDAEVTVNGKKHQVQIHVWDAYLKIDTSGGEGLGLIHNILSTFTFSDQNNTADNAIIQNVTSTFPKNTVWQKAVDTKISYTNFSTPNAKQRFVNGISRTGMGIVKSLTSTHAENQTYLKQDDWIVDNNLAADGPTGSVWGYMKKEGDKTRILQISYTNNSITPVPNQPLQLTCPCKLTYKIFLSDPF